MKYIDCYIFSIYNTYRKIHDIAPWMVFGGPKYNAAIIAALYPALMVFSTSLLFNIWSSADLVIYQLFTVLISLFVWYFLSNYFKSRIIKAETSNVLSKIGFRNIIVTNIFIASILILTIYCFIIKL